MYQNKKILVTGGAGLIGSYLVDLLVKDDNEVVVIDDFSKGKLENLKQNLNHIELKEGNLENIEFVKKALEGIDIVYHLASRAYGIGYSKSNHTNILLHNERITNNLIDVFKSKKPEKILIVSSSCVYSDVGPDVISEDEPLINEPEIANMGYGWAKRFLEKKFIIFSNETEIPLSIVRPFNIYGERYNWVGEYSQAIPMLMKKVLDQNNPIVIWGSGNQKRNYLHAYDCARIIKIIMEKNDEKKIVNIGSEETISIFELVQLIMKVTGNNLEVKFDTSKPEGRFIKSSDTTILKKILEGKKLHSISIEDGLSKMIGWYEKTFKS